MEPPTKGGEVVAAGVDWITATANRQAGAGLLANVAWMTVQRAARNGAKLRKWRWNDYVGQATEHAAWGIREDSVCCRLSSWVACTYWRDVYQAARKVTRLDVQVTVRPEPPEPRLALEHGDECANWAQHRPRPPKILKREGIPAGHSVDIGKGSSAQYGRIYDKYAESGDDQWVDCWRYEVEVKDRLATRLADALGAEQHAERACVVYVHDWFAGRGIRPVFSRRGGVVRLAREGATDPVPRRLKWLTEQVAPAIAELCATGHAVEAWKAVGIPPLLLKLWLEYKGGSE